MKKIFMMISLLMLLSGCGVAQIDKETVRDSVLASAKAWTDDASEIRIQPPANAELVYYTEEMSCYIVNDGELEIVTLRMLCSDEASAVRRLTGYDMNNLNTLKKNSALGDELYVTWPAVGEEESRVYTADIVIDGTYAYSVMCSFSENAVDRYDEEIREVFSGFVLSKENAV